MLKMNDAGDTLWLRRYNYQPTDIVGHISLLPDPHGGYVVSGTFNGCPTIVHMDGDGIVQWAGTYTDHSTSGIVVDLAMGADSTYLWLLYRDNTGLSGRSVVVRFRPNPAGTLPVPLTPVSDFRLQQNYPNPFNPTTEIAFDVARAGRTSLKVYDLMGREVAILSNGILQAGAHHVTYDAHDLPSGVYFYRLESGSQTQTRKMLLLK
jgi:hypothetical protein